MTRPPRAAPAMSALVHKMARWQRWQLGWLTRARPSLSGCPSPAPPGTPALCCWLAELRSGVEEKEEEEEEEEEKEEEEQDKCKRCLSS